MADDNTKLPASRHDVSVGGKVMRDPDEIDLLALLRVLWASRKDIVVITTFFAIFSIIFALLQPNIFRAEAVLAPAEVRQSSSPLVSQLGAAASLVGINMGENGGQAADAIAILKSREFTRRFIAEHQILPYLMASEWDRSEGRQVIDPDLYDVTTNTWLRDTVPSEPSDWSAYNVFSRILRVQEESASGLIRIAIEWRDPAQAMQWVNWLVEDINRHIKERDLTEARNSIAYLQDQLAATQLVEMQRVFYQLIESQTRVVMLADVRDEYVFQVIDPAVVPEDRVSPNRALICIIGTMLGGVLSLLYVFIEYQAGGFNYPELHRRIRLLIQEGRSKLIATKDRAMKKTN